MWKRTRQIGLFGMAAVLACTAPAAGERSESQQEYAATAAGFTTLLEGERIWVFRDGAEELDDFKANGELAKHVIRPAAGPLGMTVKGPDAETIDAYLQAKGL